MTELERLLHNLVSAAANVATADSANEHHYAGEARDEAVRELAAYLDKKNK